MVNDTNSAPIRIVVICTLVAVGERMPAWIEAGIDEYTKRLPRDYQLIIKSVAAIPRRSSGGTAAVLKKEAERLIAACPKRATRIALDRQGKAISTESLATQLEGLHDDAQDIALLIGGPEGLCPTLLADTPLCWSLSKLTLPHPMVRVIVAEQFYRAVSLIQGHPYHRG